MFHSAVPTLRLMTPVANYFTEGHDLEVDNRTTRTKFNIEKDILRTFCEPGPPSRGLAQDGAAADAEHDRLRVTEDGGDLVTAGALDVHEVAVRVLHEALQLVLALLVLGARVQ